LSSSYTQRRKDESCTIQDEARPLLHDVQFNTIGSDFYSTVVCLFGGQQKLTVNQQLMQKCYL
jgi:hypothetical protein